MRLLSVSLSHTKPSSSRPKLDLGPNKKDLSTSVEMTEKGLV
jgi:hypothetical protein